MSDALISDLRIALAAYDHLRGEPVAQQVALATLIDTVRALIAADEESKERAA